MQREHHRKHDDHKDSGAAKPGHHGGAAKPGHHGGGGGAAAAGKVGAGNPALLSSEPDHQQDKDKDEDAEEGAGDGESGPVASAARVKQSREDIEDNIKDAWQAVKLNEASIVRGLYDRLREDKDAGKKRSSGFFGSLFNDLTSAGVSHLISKVHPGVAVATTLMTVFNAAKAGIEDKLQPKGGGSKILASDFLETYVRDHITAGWLDGANKLESEMNKFGKKGLLALRKHMRTLARDSSREGAGITDTVLNAWMRALNQEHKRNEPKRDFDTETSGRLHFEGVDIIPPPELEPQKPFEERFHNLTAYLDGTGTIRNRLLERPITGVQVPITVAGSVATYGNFSFGIGPSDRAPTPGPSDSGGQLGVHRYGNGGKGNDWTVGINKLWNKMKVHKVGDLVGDNKNGGKSEDIQGSKDD